MTFPYKEFGLKNEKLYEILATTYKFSEQFRGLIPNTSCIGIRMTKKGNIKMNPYPTTTTFKNLKRNGIVIINFIDNIYLYALAALKQRNNEINIKIPKESYDFLHIKTPFAIKNEKKISILPFLKEAWGLLVCKSIKEKKKVKKSNLGSIEVTEFIIKVNEYQKLRESYKLFNRAENLTLEVIIIATRLKVAIQRKNLEKIKEYQEKIEYYFKEIRRFGKNKEALNAIDLVERYITSFLQSC
jgi:hypothetical protein